MQKIPKILRVLLIGLLVFSPLDLMAQTNPNVDVEARVRSFFGDIPVMISIANCETHFKQYKPDGSAYHDGTGTYIGVFQISEKLHTPRATSFGVNLATLDGNMAYARYLYDTSGTNPWKGCLKPTETGVVSAQPTPTGSLLTANLNFGMTNPQVLTLQQILNRLGFVVAQSGPGSVGNETTYFGSLTREAVRKFQCSKGIACDGSESTTGFGRVGPRTRAALNQL